MHRNICYNFQFYVSLAVDYEHNMFWWTWFFVFEVARLKKCKEMFPVW